jgi:hypothetical protein
MIFCIFKKSRLLLKIADLYQKVARRSEPAGIRAHFGFFFGHLCFFACGEGRRRVCGFPQSLWRQLNNHHHHRQGFLSGARVQFHLPTGVESSIHRYVSKSLPFISMYLNPSIHRSGLKTSWRVMCKHRHNLLHLLIHLLLHTPVVIHYQIHGLLLSGAGLTNNPLSFLVKGGEAEADIDIR